MIMDVYYITVIVIVEPLQFEVDDNVAVLRNVDIYRHVKDNS